MKNITDEQARLLAAADMVRETRRKYNNQLHQLVLGKSEEYNGEDLMRLVGTLEATYNHLLAAVASDNDIYCALKHLSYAIILVGEMNEPEVGELYEVMSIITNGVIEPCASCKQEEEIKNGKEENPQEIKERT